MRTTAWLIIAALIGFDLNLYLAQETNPLIGAAIGFGSGGALRLAMATGDADIFGSLLEGIGDMLGAIFEGIGN